MHKNNLKKRTKISPTIAGAKLGPFLSSQIKNSSDALVIAKLLQKTLENGASGLMQQSRNSFTSNFGDVLPFPAYLEKDDSVCRKAILTYGHKGHNKIYSITACRNEKGLWEVTQAKLGSKI